MGPGESLQERLNAAMALLQKGRLNAAADALEALISDGLDSVDAFRILANLRSRQERYSDAVGWLSQSLEKSPNDTGLASELVREKLMAEDYNGALALAEVVVRDAPESVEAWKNLAHARRCKGDLDGAMASLSQGMEKDARHPGIHYEYGMLWLRKGDVETAIEAFRFVTQLDSKNALAYVHLGHLMSLHHGPVVGMSYIQRALELAPYSSHVRIRAAMTFVQRGELDLAEKCLRQIFRVHPHHEEGWACMANVHERRGDYDKAVESVRPLLKGAMTRTNVAVSFSRGCLRSGNPQEGLNLLDRVLTLARPRSARRLLGHIRGDCLSRLGRYEESLVAYTEANEFSIQRFDPDGFTEDVSSIISCFSKESFTRRAKASTPSPQTILVVGMPRSGSSLVEQILSSHTRVVGLGELADLSLAKLALKHLLRVDPWEGGMDAMTEENAQSLGAWYRTRTLARVRGLDEPTEGLLGIVDKMPGNISFLGLASHILPDLKIVHTCRNPLDSCLSCFTQVFTGDGLGFSTRLNWLGRYYKDYSRLMKHWHKVLPEPILDVHYEELVTNPEPVVRGLLEHCGLEWEPGVLDFHKSARVVNTASNHQVRKPLYTSSVNKHEPYLPWLGELVEALED